MRNQLAGPIAPLFKVEAGLRADAQKRSARLKGRGPAGSRAGRGASDSVLEPRVGAGGKQS